MLSHCISDKSTDKKLQQRLKASRLSDDELNSILNTKPIAPGLINLKPANASSSAQSNLKSLSLDPNQRTADQQIVADLLRQGVGPSPLSNNTG